MYPVMEYPETEEEFIYQQIMPFCESITQKKIDKAELKRLLLLGIQRDKKGKWVRSNNYNDATCSECGILGHASYNYCPICGTDMRGEEK